MHDVFFINVNNEIANQKYNARYNDTHFTVNKLYQSSK